MQYADISILQTPHLHGVTRYSSHMLDILDDGRQNMLQDYSLHQTAQQQWIWSPYNTENTSE